MKGNVSINAGTQYTQTGSQLNALEGDIDVNARRIDINAATDTSKHVHETQFEQSGLTLAVSSPVISAMQTMQQMGEASSKTDDPRMRAMAAATAGMAAKGAVDAAQSANGGGVSISITVGKSESESKQTVTTATAVGSSVNAGNNVKLHATGDGENSSITVLGSDIKAGNEALLKAEGDINLGAAQNTAEQHSTNSSNSAGVGLAITFGNGGASFGVTANASAARGKADGKDVFYTNTHVDAVNKLTLESGGDTNLKGAVVGAKQVAAEIGGDLNIGSRQDTSVFKSREQSIGGSVTVGMGYSGSVSASKSKVDADYASVTEQSGIRAGDGGFQINVKGNTDLKGGAIASSEQAVTDGKNRLKTETLTHSDIENHDRYEASSVSLSGAGSVGPSGGNKNDAPPKPETPGMKVQAFQTGMNGATAGIGNESGSSAGTTRSGISGAIVITDEKKQIALTGKNAEQTVAETNRDVLSGQSSGSVTKAWDGQKLKEEVKAEAQITQAFSPMAAKEIGTYADGKKNEALRKADEAKDSGDSATEAQFRLEAGKWAEGGTYRVALHAAGGALAGGTAGAAGAMASASAAPLMDDLQKSAQETLEKAGLEADSAKAIAKGATGIAAAGIAAAAGGTAGAAVGLNVEVNNRQMHMANYNRLRDGCRSSSSTECETINRMAGVRSGMPVDDQNIPASQVVANYDASGNVVSYVLIDRTTNQPTMILEPLDYAAYRSASPGTQAMMQLSPQYALDFASAGMYAAAGDNSRATEHLTAGLTSRDYARDVVLGVAGAAASAATVVRPATAARAGFATETDQAFSWSGSGKGGDEISGAGKVVSANGSAKAGAKPTDIDAPSATKNRNYANSEAPSENIPKPSYPAGESGRSAEINNSSASNGTKPATANYNEVTKRTADEDLSLLDQRATTHILDGDGPTSGGHRYATGTPGKSEFPKSWSDQKIKNVISDIATDPAVSWSKPDARGYITATATRDSVEIKVVYDTKLNRIVTEYPMNLPRNPR